MNPTNNFQHLMGQDSGFLENEESLPVPLTLSDHLNPSVDSISTDNLTSTVDPEILHDLPPPASSINVIDFAFATPSTSSMPPIFSIQMQLPHPMPPVPSTSRGIQENYPDYRFEAARRSSFQNWPVFFIDPASLAAAGFYYTGEVDIVKCFECQLLAGHWLEGDIPMEIHEICSPECRFICNQQCNNVPIGADHDSRVIRTKRRNRNISCPYGLQYQESFDFNDHRFLRRSRKPTPYEILRWAVRRVKESENLEYEASAEAPAPIQIANGNPERSNNENDNNEMSSAQKIANLEEKIRELKDARTCKVCMDREATITFLPCRHLVTCHECSQAITQCIICRSQIRDVLRIFIG